jgi:FkbM family methyltransferase
MLIIEKLLNLIDNTQEQINKIKKSNLPTVLWGFGGRIPVIWDYLIDSGVEVDLICDNDDKKIGNVWASVKVVSFSELKKIYSDCNIIIVPPIKNIVDEITKQIYKDGQFKNVFQFEMYYPYGVSIKKVIKDNFNKIEIAYNLFADEESRKVFEDQLKYSVSKDRKYLADCSENEYFDEEVLLFSTEEYYCDCGVFDGETVFKMKKIGFLGAYCFEPDPINFTVCQSRFKNENNVKIINAAVWNKRERVQFASELKGGSAITNKGKILVETVRLDDYFQNKEVTFIKMDIEGAEREALEGAKDILKNKAPKLAIAAYHKMSDLWNLPIDIKKYNNNYKVFVRRYIDDIGYDSLVFYATI